MHKHVPTYAHLIRLHLNSIQGTTLCSGKRIRNVLWITFMTSQTGDVSYTGRYSNLGLVKPNLVVIEAQAIRSSVVRGK